MQIQKQKQNTFFLGGMGPDRTGWGRGVGPDQMGGGDGARLDWMRGGRGAVGARRSRGFQVSWSIVGSRIKDHGSRIGSWIKDQGSKIKDNGSRIMDRIKNQRSRIKDEGPCPGTIGHPRRAVDVILRQSRAPIEIYNPRWVPRLNSYRK